MLSRWPRTAFLCAPLLLALAPVSDELAFKPKDGTEVAKKLELELELGLDDFSLSVNGQDVGKDAVQGLDGASVLLHFAAGTTDKYVKSEGGKIVELLRTYDDLALKSEMGDESSDDTDVDAFEGHTVRFRWDAEKKEYAKSWEGKAADDDALADLSPDLDVTCLLPEKKVAEGDTWEVKGEALAGLFFPGGLMPMKADEGDEESAAAEALVEQLEKKLEEFKVTCTYKGAREDGKLQVGEVAFQFDGKAALDLAQLLEEAMAEDAEGEMPEIDVQSAMTLKGEGTLTWDLAGGHLRTLHMEADLGLSVDAKAQMEQEGQSLDLAAHFAASGKGTWDLGVK